MEMILDRSYTKAVYKTLPNNESLMVIKDAARYCEIEFLVQWTSTVDSV